MKTSQEFITELKVIIERLNNLQNEYAEIYKQYEGNNFDTHMHCSTVIENLVLMLTHEIVNEMSFGISEFKQVINYMSFRKKYFEYSDFELSKIIDCEITSSEELEITRNKEEKNIHEIKSSWNSNFKHLSYAIFKEISLKL